MLFRGLIIVSLALISGQALGQSETAKADPRAIAACQTEGAAFTTISKCVPDAHSAFGMFDAFDEIYSVEAQHLKDRCIELNDGNGENGGISAAAVCIRNAIEDAISLADALPEGSEITDPVYIAVSDRDKFTELMARVVKYRDDFPDNPSGMIMYQSYQ